MKSSGLLRLLYAAARIVIPFLGALAVLQGEGLLTSLVRSRPGVLPVAMVALLAGLLYAPVRQWLIVTLCFGIALLAQRDSTNPRGVPFPAELDYVWIERLYPVVWTLIAILAAGAGIVEAYRPGNVWARRGYFGAAAIYFGGHGFFGFLRSHNADSLVLAGTGVVAALGVVFAHRIVAAESTPELLDEDLIEQAERVKRRSAALAEREWREAPEEMQPASQRPGYR